jgi:2,5-diamino-6-(ribosylamino)-4(3H)-pyrimidinone 5'-phosphate reductase
MKHYSDLRVTINTAMTVDGKIATISGDSAISSKQDLKRIHKLRSSSDAIIVGISTVLVDNPRLTVRLAKKRKEDPARIIIDSTGRIPLSSKLLKTAYKVKTIVAVTKRAPNYKIHEIRNTGATVIIAGTEVVDLKEVFLNLKKMGVRKILVEGGGELNWSLLSLGIVDELIVTIAPRIVGGRMAATLVEGDGYTKISEGIKMKLKNVLRQNDDELVLYYKISPME